MYNIKNIFLSWTSQGTCSNNKNTSAINWPLSTIRLSSTNKLQLVECATHIFNLWKNYSDIPNEIISHTDGTPHNTMKGVEFKSDLATAYPNCRLVVTKETMTVEGMTKIVYDLLKDKLNIAKITFTSGVNMGSEVYETKNQIDRCPLCGIALNKDGICPKCGYRSE